MIQIITHTGKINHEPTLWLQLLQAGADSILVRKPGWQEADYEMLLLEANPSCYPHLIIADHPALCERYGLLGIHFGEAIRGSVSQEELLRFQQLGCMLSTSIHSVMTLQVVSNIWNQVLISPVFDSISKTGYKAAFDTNFRLDKDGYAGNVLALGGINQHTADKARHMLFDGIALHGAIWQHPERAVRNFISIRDAWSGNSFSSS
ncbi:thiamine phosphate synthase [Chitinophaga sancti]|uniref:thiamine phosphate synthase n=1 Tax=Chitinophaga sancti TaxID=1004 RepID=UPI002A75ABAF|nr:thiamine phosphate synthase [Chitinophaga sancti]WPQ64125.1 thiamine phosphate synthase [Chitinophaga sancti]